MASEEHHETFESTDAGASLTYPQQAGTIRKNGYMVAKGRPCKVADVSTSKTGKHGHAKCNFVCIDIFTGKKYEEMTPSSHNMDVPNIARLEYTLLDINEEGFCTLMMENGDTREDLQLPKGTEEADKLAETIREQFGAGQELIVSVLKAMGEEMINTVKIVNQ
ncbi:eukaryotic translation initiation factor 5A [Raphidocelis subcapitata]|uniref:Eukaryotic translation initiation factor 5A n=1 Tax=Raphidocelis subcapitata TaxID=307507 RepID=A0A2V0NLN5_9CHLO|nr:eukaryotic translation initiation factor 5A [Raphidocelis subcapitata]|eukprot:GBF88344.1 eukaryotic translation initiation factor 5A [Raphidocelis subcapitata]